ncbi:MAG: hypothetical protein IKT40_12080 [Bacilli bacterium]|nr:hypothetical protein [Bacilli bacterium]
MTFDSFKKLKIGDSIGSYKIVKINKDSGVFFAKRNINCLCDYLKCHYSLFLIYNKELKKYE